MDLYNENIKLLQAGGTEYTAPDEYKNEYEVTECKNGCVTLKVKSGERFLYLHSKYNPVAEAEKFAGNLKFSTSSIIICFGMGFGYQIKQLLGKLSEKNLLIIYEPDPEITDLMLKNIDCGEIFSDERVKVFLNGDIEAFHDYIYDVIPEYAHTRACPIVLPVYPELHPYEYAEFIKAVSETLKSKVTDKNTVKFFISAWNRNFIRNIPTILDSYGLESFKDMFCGKPVVIVAAGPSLEKNIHLLKKIKGRVLIIGVYAVLKAMLKHGILPDMIVSVDARQLPIDYEELSRLPLFYASPSNNVILNGSNGKRIHLLSIHEIFTARLLLEYEKQEPMLTLGGSVTCVALEIAKEMGAGSIIFVGLDLSFPDNKLHIEGTNHVSKTVDQVKADKVYVNGIHGEKLLSTVPMQSYIHWFERYLSADKSDTVYIDATEGGALIKGMEIYTLESAMENFCGDGYDVEKTMCVAFDNGRMFTDGERLEILKYMANDPNVFKNMLAQVTHAVELSEKLLKIYKYNSKPKKNEIDKILASLDAVDGEIKKMGLMKDVFSIYRSTIDGIAEREPEEDEDAVLSIAQLSIDMYSEYKKALTETCGNYEVILPIIKNQITELENAGVTATTHIKSSRRSPT